MAAVKRPPQTALRSSLLRNAINGFHANVPISRPLHSLAQEARPGSSSQAGTVGRGIIHNEIVQDVSTNLAVLQAQRRMGLLLETIAGEAMYMEHAMTTRGRRCDALTRATERWDEAECVLVLTRVT